MRVTVLPCPHCKAGTKVIKTRPVTSTFKEITYQCNDHECGHIFVAGLEVLRTVSLSSKPDHSLKIPISQHVRQAVLSQLALNNVVTT